MNYYEARRQAIADRAEYLRRLQNMVDDLGRGLARDLGLPDGFTVVYGWSQGNSGTDHGSTDPDEAPIRAQDG